MKPSAITFDVAGTLVDTRWNPCRVVEEAAQLIGLDVAENAGDAFGALYARRLPDFHAANLTSDEAVEAFWIQLDADWLELCNLDPRQAPALYQAGHQLLFSPGSRVFVPYLDAEPALTRLKQSGFRLAAVSNWDNSLSTVLTMFGWTELFDAVVPSLVFGHEKPDRRIFDHALSLLESAATDVLHVGDDAIDDLVGARGAGLRAVLVDRSRNSNNPPYIRSLDDVERAFEWTV